MSKPWGDPSRGISSGDVLIRPERHPACRRREAQPGSCTERENLCSDAKGEITSGSNREDQSTDAGRRGGAPHIPFERYADDIICHCKSAEEATFHAAVTHHARANRACPPGRYQERP